jgi:hypothetical protein
LVLGSSLILGPGQKLPARFDDSRNYAGKRHFAKAYPAQTEAPKESALPSATSAPVICAYLELRFLIAFFDHRFSCHSLFSSFCSCLFTERHSHFFKKRQGVFVGFCRGAYNDIHARYVGHLIAVDFHEYDLFLDAERIVAVAVE